MSFMKLLRLFVVALMPFGFVAAPQAGAQPSWLDGEQSPQQPAAEQPQLAADPAGLVWRNAPAVVLPPLNIAPLLAEDAANANAPGVPLRVGVDRPIQIQVDPNRAAGWSVDPNGVWSWRARVSTPGAVISRLWFERVALLDGATLMISDPNEQLVHEISRSTPMGRRTWTPLVPGDTILVEYRVPQAPAVGVPLIVGGISHIYRLAGGGAGDGPDPDTFCEIDVACRSTSWSSRNAVGRMTYSSGGQQFNCSGALLNDFDPASFVPYFLTANHCVSTQAEVDSLTVYWFYQADFCGGPVAPLWRFPSTTGGTLLATTTRTTGTDMTFIRLVNDLPGGLGFAGWTTRLPVAGETLVGIHHPGGEPKQYSAGLLASRSDCLGTAYHYGNWFDGSTRGGSSGSPLFDADGLIVGQLFGKCCPRSHGLPGEPCALSGCENRDEWRWGYGRFDLSYPLLRPFLESSQDTWVNFAYSGPEDGSFLRPFNTLSEGVANAPCGGTIRIIGSSSETGVFGRPADCPVIIESWEGSATIGG